jgi:hypothetical protein
VGTIGLQDLHLATLGAEYHHVLAEVGQGPGLADLQVLGIGGEEPALWLGKGITIVAHAVNSMACFQIL